MNRIHDLLAVVAVVLVSFAGNEVGAQEFQSILKVNEPILVDQGPVVVQGSVLENSVAPGPELISPNADSIPQLAPVSPPPSYIELPQAFHKPIEQLPVSPIVVCKECQCKKCCCKPKKVEATVCLVDLHGCDHEVCIEVPVCCQNEAPTVSWKHRRLLGRQVATLCWDCCDHEVKVVVTRRGKVRVHD